MRKKHYIRTVEDIKHCEENGRMLFSKDNIHSFKFERGCWSEYDDEGNLWIYNASIDPEEVHYYEEESEEQQEATEKDVGRLCWFYDTEKMNNRKVVGKLREVLQDDNFPFRSDYGIPSIHCRPLTKEEIKEFMEKAE